MAYFLKKSKNKKGIYLQMYDSFYDPIKDGTAHKSIRPIGYVHELIESGIEDPIAYYKQEIAELNKKRKQVIEEEKVKKIGATTPEILLGYAPFKAINDALGVSTDLNYLQLGCSYRFSITELLNNLMFARLVQPCSKRATFVEVIPKMQCTNNFSSSQLYDGIEFLGENYQRIIDIYNASIDSCFKRNTDFSYFDCTNFYFEIDKEDTLRKKGPSKEKKTDPIVGLGLLLDAEQIPIAMKIFPGNESETPKLKEVLTDLKKKHNIVGKTVRVADKGLNCSDNIVSAILDGDGYIFSKSVKQLSEKELMWVLDQRDLKYGDENKTYALKSCIDKFAYTIKDENGKNKKVFIEEKRVVTFNKALQSKQKREIQRQVDKARNLRLSGAKKSQYGDSSKYVNFNTIDDNGCINEQSIITSLNHDAINKAYSLAGYNMIVTSEATLSDKEIYQSYHNLWRIEESFRAMKSQLDARPVYLQKENSIKGHFLICYLDVLLLRILQIKVLSDKYSTEEIMNMARKFRVVQTSDRKYLNISKSSELLEELERITKAPFCDFYLTKTDLKKIENCKISF